MSKCPDCGDDFKPGDRFCQGCGFKLSAPAGIVIEEKKQCVCGSTEFDEDGYCLSCGKSLSAQLKSGYAAAQGLGLAAITDVGLRHTRNDDAFSINGSGSGGINSIMVVCDGVSNSQTPDIAASAAARIACDWIAEKNVAGSNVEQTVAQAIRQAHGAVCAVPFNRQDTLDPPACTIAIAVIQADQDPSKRQITVGWLGDSRVYLLDTQGGQMLTEDHSWMNDVVNRGEKTLAEARSDRRAHAITKCLGTEDFSNPTDCPEPSVKTFSLPATGRILVCSDGLWNYAETAEEIGQAANGSLWTQDIADTCKRLVEFAKRKGGQDNITVAMCEVL